LTNRFSLEDITIRRETKKDYLLVEKMIREAFWNVYKPKCDEHYLTHLLRTHEDYLPELTRIALYQGQVVGAIFYAKSQIVTKETRHDVITFGPLAVHPEFQRQGIGTILMRETIHLAKKLGYKAIIIYGEPNYYPKHGFKRAKDFEITQLDGTYLDALMTYELEDGYLQDKKGYFLVSEVYLNIEAEDVEIYDRQF